MPFWPLRVQSFFQSNVTLQKLSLCPVERDFIPRLQKECRSSLNLYQGIISLGKQPRIENTQRHIT